MIGSEESGVFGGLDSRYFFAQKQENSRKGDYDYEKFRKKSSIGNRICIGI